MQIARSLAHQYFQSIDHVPRDVDICKAVGEPSTFSFVIIHDSFTPGDLQREVRSAFEVKESPAVAVGSCLRKPRQYAFTYDTTSLQKEIEDFLSYKDVRFLQGECVFFGENPPTHIPAKSGIRIEGR
jgi:hypothetical protein